MRHDAALAHLQYTLPIFVIPADMHITTKLYLTSNYRYLLELHALLHSLLCKALMPVITPAKSLEYITACQGCGTPPVHVGSQDYRAAQHADSN